MAKFASSIFLFLILYSTGFSQVKSPAEFLGYELGDRFTPHHQMVAYVQHVAANSDMVDVYEYGKTYEGRPLIVAYVSSPENVKNRDQIQKDNQRRAGFESGSPTTNIGITWLSYNIHGNESNSMEAAMKTLYTLVTSDGFNSKEWLKNTLVIIDPCMNPDGRDRYANWYNQMMGTHMNALPEAREHDEPWPGGRANHYYFDLNRDWAWQTQTESRQRNTLLQSWLPHVHVDLHEQGYDSPYYFAPAAQPMHADITPWQREFQTMIGKNNAKYFDKNSWLYFTKEVFDLLYPSYGDTWPTYNGAIGMTYEQAGGGRAGLGILKQEGDTLTLRDRLMHHFTASMSTVETSSVNNKRMLDEFAAFFEKGRTKPDGEFSSFILKADGNYDRLNELTSWLTTQNIAWGKAGSSKSYKGYDYKTGKNTSFKVEADDIVISAFQNKGILAKILFEPKTTLVDSVTYDITAWALPYVYGIQAYATSTRINPSDAVVTKPSAPKSTNKDVYAWIAEWKSMDDARFVADLLKSGFILRYAQHPFSVDGQNFDAGSVYITRNGNERISGGFDNAVKKLAEKHGQPVFAAPSGFVDAGYDVGSSNVPFLKAPKVAVLMGDGTSSLSAGQVWHYMDEFLEYPATMINVSNISRLPLHNYDVIIMPEGWYSDMFSDSFTPKLKEWVQSGGKLIAISSAARTLSRVDGLGSIKLKKSTQDSKTETTENQIPYAMAARHSISSSVVGAIFEATLDKTHPLSFGLGESYFTLRDGSTQFELLSGGWNAAVLGSGSHRSGFVGAEIKGSIDNSLVFGEERVGRGSIIYFADNPIFRGFWYGGKLAFANAIFLAGR